MIKPSLLYLGSEQEIDVIIIILYFCDFKVLFDFIVKHKPIIIKW